MLGNRNMKIYGVLQKLCNSFFNNFWFQLNQESGSIEKEPLYVDVLPKFNHFDCGRQEEPAILISSLFLCMHRMHVASIRLDFH